MHSRRQPSFRSRHPHLVRVFPPVILLFRLLSIVPASMGCVSHLWNLVDPSRHLPQNSRVDYFVALLWVRRLLAMLLLHHSVQLSYIAYLLVPL